MALALLEHRFDGPRHAPVVLLLPAVGTRWSMWEPQLPELTRHLRVLRVNLRYADGEPVGATVEAMAEAVVRLVAARELERVSIVGAALGSMVALTVARQAPRTVGRLGLLAASTRLRNPLVWQHQARTALGSGMPAVQARTSRSWFTPRFLQDRPDISAAFARELTSMSPKEFAAAAAAYADADVRQRLGHISQPSMVISFAHDPESPPHQGRQLAAGLPGCRFVVVRGGAHLANVERPDRVNELLLRHLVG